ncbi:MAG: SPOR domain-containing protein [Calditrichaeota bacterium]|nr:MAG: SPOR domain-containing protein [Calditrichota bacterium]MBL1203816.1 SPOR domain-containing protein [Calditrichota bacterium]NOG43646.1 SPOR domain-containing protein [Calditrichota bacterium]
MKTLTTLIVFTLLIACSSTQKTVVQDTENSGSGYDESFDPNTLNDDDIVIAKLENVVPESKTKDIENSLDEGEIKFREGNGFRVQLVATKNIEAATLTESEAKDIFNSKYTVYLIFDAPLYKVRVGDAANRNAAEEIREMAKNYGYREAFIVPSKVNIPVKNSF